MAQARIDQNDVRTWIGYNETTGLPDRVRVDPVLGAVLVFNVAPAASSPTAVNTAQIDQNDVRTQLAYNASSGLPEAIRCDTNGVLLITP